ncbi:hypothetical protein [Chryseobacterium bernardetii]|uniref:hypothetical protein n=1 Tax=Chryseobacterium bernardetii TaxID=1241978 RepID=UPI003AF62940
MTKDENGEITVYTRCVKKPILDTLNYLKQFEANKAQYIGKPFSVLLNDMTKIQPKTVWPKLNMRYKTFIIGNYFKFANKEFSFHNAVTLSITWQDTIPMNQFNYYGKKNQFYFTQEERDFYGSKIIKDILVYR